MVKQVKGINKLDGAYPFVGVPSFLMRIFVEFESEQGMCCIEFSHRVITRIKWTLKAFGDTHENEENIIREKMKG